MVLDEHEGNVPSTPSPVRCADEWTILPNQRLGLRLSDGKGGRKVYLAADGRTRLCEHGETFSYILKHRGAPRPEGCTCQNADSLCISRWASAPAGWRAPSYYEVLCATGAEEIALHGGRRARRIPFMSGSAAYMTASGSIRCAHGNSATTLLAMRSGVAKRRFLRPCACHPTGWQRDRLVCRVAEGPPRRYPLMHAECDS